MPVIHDDDGSEDVNDFLKRIKEDRDQRDKEDEERTRKLEEEIMQGRKERQARRAERARSLSPTKDTPSSAGTPGSVHSRNDLSMQEDFSKLPSLPPPQLSSNQVMDDTPQKLYGSDPDRDTQDNAEAPRAMPQPLSKPQALSRASPSAAVGPARSGTLSWQQRPSSRSSAATRSRPASVLAPESSAGKGPEVDINAQSLGEKGVSRNEIAQSLGSKDPAWFKQTQDRGLGSAAYRRSQGEDASDTSSKTGGMRLPGMSRESTAEPESRMSSPPDSSRPVASTRDGSIRSTAGFGHRFSGSTSISSVGGTLSPIPAMSSQRFEPPSSDTSSSHGCDTSTSRALAMSPSQGRLSPDRVDRPSSPTKGLGGFVQSAMLKRSDSVNKRWSAQAPPGLTRGNSISSNRSGFEAPRYPIGGIPPLGEARSNRLSREASPAPISRPQSSHSNATVTRKEDDDTIEAARTSTQKRSPPSRSSFSKTTLQQDDKSPSPSEPEGQQIMSPPSSPSKRWSPTKSSWLENAIKKPESPKILSPAATQQPSWMADINRAKQQRGSVDLGKGANFKEVTTNGLMKSPPLGSGYKAPGFNGIPSAVGTAAVTSSRRENPEDLERSFETSRSKDTLSSSASEAPVEEMSMLKINQTRSQSTLSTGNLTADTPREFNNLSRSETPPTKQKPETPPKKDFTSTLKPRQISGKIKAKDEPEFKNVFGKLKRTQTQNYVAPDELKDNILRGKAGLAVTGGPRKTDRKDEFKESILKKKQGMVAPTASTRITSATSRNPETSTPEAIKMRQGLTRPDGITNDVNADNERKHDVEKPEALAKLQLLRDRPNPSSLERPPSTGVGTSKAMDTKAKLGGGFASSLSEKLQKRPPPISSTTKPSMNETTDHNQTFQPTRASGQEEVQQAGPQLTHATKSRARGPKRRLPTASNQEAVSEQPVSEQKRSPMVPSKENKPFIPKESPKSPVSPLSFSKIEPRPLSNITNSNNNNRQASQPQTPRKPSTTITQDKKNSTVTSQTSNKELQLKPSPIVKQKPLSPRTPSISKPSSPQSPIPQIAPKASPQQQARPPSSPVLLRQTEITPLSQESETASPSVKGAAAIWGHSTPTSSRARSPIKLPTRKDEEAAAVDAGIRPKESATPVAQHYSVETKKASVSAHSPRSPKTLPPTGKKPESIASKVASITLPPPANAQTPSSPTSSSEVTQLFANIFDEPPSSKTNISVDAQAVLDARASNDSSQKIKTLRKQISEVVDNGKVVPVPSHQEHILFEDSLYLCTHVFGTSAGQRTTEVYLWCGDGASPSTVEDAQLFAKRVAKEHNGKLILLKQGKETPNFFQALGGIVITRRGSSSRAESSSSSSATYVLCGRQHVGQIAFDEVDFRPSSLCSGFPYIISARFGKLFLWKGTGAGADELGCARLIGMDLGLTGEIEEVDEGKEPADFWASFPEPRPAFVPDANTQYWRLKPSCERYANRLFRIDVETSRPKSSSGFMSWGRRGSAPSNDANQALATQVREIVAFSQQDLRDDGVFVLDAFFEIFVIHPIYSLAPSPHHRSTAPASFRAALLFAQEYGILSASAEDRPFVPHCYVVLLAQNEKPAIGRGKKGREGVPEGVKTAFRKWTDDGKECRILDLREALLGVGASRGLTS